MGTSRTPGGSGPESEKQRHMDILAHQARRAPYTGCPKRRKDLPPPLARYTRSTIINYYHGMTGRTPFTPICLSIVPAYFGCMYIVWVKVTNRAQKTLRR